MKIIVTIPAYNEEKTIAKVVKEIKRNVQAAILVIDDGSTDDTVKEAKQAGASVISHPMNYGLALTFRTEMKEALKLKPDIIVHTDADGQYLASDIPRLIKPVKEKRADLVLGSRFKGKIEHMAFIKRFGNKAFSRIISKIVGKKISDAQTGFRAFTPEIAKLLITSNHTYTQEQIIRAMKEKFSIVEVPVYFAKRKDKSRLMKHPFEYALKAWINLMRIYRDYEPLKFFGFFGASSITLGLILGVWILYTLLQTGQVGGIPRVILSALFIMTGVQIFLFGFLADMHRK
ncbi:glycosyltransferase [Candidatus Woesearchaeota archaeon]|nr:glycosyltransferase [Candidatus Woesearchaeota archaeon]